MITNCAACYFVTKASSDCVCVGGGEVRWDGKGGRKDVTESYGGDQVDLS